MLGKQRQKKSDHPELSRRQGQWNQGLWHADITRQVLSLGPTSWTFQTFNYFMSSDFYWTRNYKLKSFLNQKVSWIFDLHEFDTIIEMLLLWLLTCFVDCLCPLSKSNWHPDVWDLHAKHGAFIVHAQAFVAVGDCKGAPVVLGSCFGIISWCHQYQNMF